MSMSLRSTTRSHSQSDSSHPNSRAVVFQFFIARFAAQHLHARNQVSRKESPHLPVSIGMRLAHEPMANQGNINLRHMGFSLV